MPVPTSVLALALADAPARPARSSLAFYSGVEGEWGEAATVSVPIIPHIRVYAGRGWGLDVDSSMRPTEAYDMTSRTCAVWTPTPGADLVPYVRAGVAFGNRDVPDGPGGRLGVGPTVGFGLERWLAPWLAVDVVADADLFWSTPDDAAGWERGADASLRVGVRVAFPSRPAPGM